MAREMESQRQVGFGMVHADPGTAGEDVCTGEVSVHPQCQPGQKPVRPFIFYLPVDGGQEGGLAGVAHTGFGSISVAAPGKLAGGAWEEPCATCFHPETERPVAHLPGGSALKCQLVERILQLIAVVAPCQNRFLLLIAPMIIERDRRMQGIQPGDGMAVPTEVCDGVAPSQAVCRILIQDEAVFIEAAKQQQ